MINDHRRKKSLCDLLRNAAFAFIQQTSADPSDDARFRSEIDCLLALWSEGRVDPLSAFAPAPPLPPEEEQAGYVPLHG